MKFRSCLIEKCIIFVEFRRFPIIIRSARGTISFVNDECKIFLDTQIILELICFMFKTCVYRAYLALLQKILIAAFTFQYYDLILSLVLSKSFKRVVVFDQPNLIFLLVSINIFINLYFEIWINIFFIQIQCESVPILLMSMEVFMTLLIIYYLHIIATLTNLTKKYSLLWYATHCLIFILINERGEVS